MGLFGSGNEEGREAAKRIHRKLKKHTDADDITIRNEHDRTVVELIYEH